MSTNWTDNGLLPATVASAVMTAVEEQSAVLSLATVRPMPAGVEYLPLAANAPKAEWIDTGERKPYQPVEWSAEKLVAREVAVTTCIEDAYINDTSFDAEGEAERALAAAISAELDRVVLFGGGPPGFPPDGIVGTAPIAGATAPEALDAALAAVEESGAFPNGIISGASLGSAMRQAYLAAQALPSERPADQVFGIPARITAVWDPSRGDAVVGDFRFLVIGVRQDITVETSQDAVLTDGEGGIIVSAFEQDVTVIRAHARFACAIGKPVSPGSGQPIEPFATASWSGASGASASAAQKRGSGGQFTKNEAA